MKKTVLCKNDIQAELLEANRRQWWRSLLAYVIFLPLCYVMFRLTDPLCKPFTAFLSAVFRVLYQGPLLIVAFFFVLSIIDTLVTARRIRAGHFQICTDILTRKEKFEPQSGRYRTDQRYVFRFARYGDYIARHQDDMDTQWRNSENEYLYPWGEEGDAFYLVIIGKHIERIYHSELFEIVD